MRIIKFDSVGGASGDMILGALIGLGVDVSELNKSLENLVAGEEYQIISKEFGTHGIHGLQATVEIDNESHCHRGLKDITSLINGSTLPDEVKEMSLKVFTKLAHAEAKIHNTTPEEIHFHEVGAVDSIVDIVGCCLAMYILKVDAVELSPLPLGQGMMKIQHGTYPIPAPATLELLQGIQVAPTDEPFEMVTPTGAALLTTWNSKTVPDGSRVVDNTYSFGQRKLNNRPNLLRAVLYEVSEEDTAPDKCVVLETNIDDCSPEIIGALFNKLLDSGALDVFTSSIQMKKQRPGTLLTVLSAPQDVDRIQEMIFRETTTFGIRKYTAERAILNRRFEEVETSYGTVKMKIGSLHGEEITVSPEIEDCIKLAKENHVAVKEVYNAAIQTRRQ